MKIKENTFLKNNIAWILGVIVMIGFLIPYLVLGADSSYIMHDQFDSEIFTYIFHARDIGLSNFPEFMNGAAKTSLTMPAPGFLILYLIFKPSTAYLIQYIIVAFSAFFGMYLLATEVTKNKYIAAVAAVAFACLPSYTTYGFSIMGQPLFFYAVIKLWQGRKEIRNYLLIALFGVLSSLVLIGFANCGILVICLICTYIRKKEKKIKRSFWISTVELIAIYLSMNLKLLYQVFVKSEAIHKDELVVSSLPFLSNVREILLNGYFHAASVHTIIFYATVLIMVLVLVLLLVNRKKQIFSEAQEKTIRSNFRLVLILFLSGVFIAVFYGIWHSTFFVSIRNNMGILNAAQLDRIYWLYPTLWYLVFALLLNILLHIGVPMLIKGILMVVLSVSVLLHVADSNYSWKATTLHFLGIETPELTLGNVSFSQFFAEDLFDDIKEYIGLDTQEYKVASLGMYPSVPLYNGLYCIDGYSNNYSLEHKHAIREIISDELDKNEDMKKYFDLWGCRCYLFCSEIPQRYFITKEEDITVNDLTFNTEAMHNLGCDYLLSTVEIGNAEEIQLELLQEFEREDSIYHIYLYHFVSE